MKRKFIKIKLAFFSTCLLFIASVSNAQLPEFVWAKQVGNAHADGEYGRSVAVDKEGNVYTAGEFKDTVKLQIGSSIETIISNGNYDVFITKQDSTGKFLWIKSFGGSGSDNVNAIAVNNTGEVYLTGNYNGTADFDPSANKEERTATPNGRGNAGTDFYISKLSSAGSFMWVKVGGNVGADAGKGIACDKHSDDIYFTGNFGSGHLNLDFGQGIIALRNNGGTASFVLKMKSDGSITWAKVLGDLGTGSVSANAIAVDIKGNIYTTGSYSGTTDFNPDTSASFPMTPVAKSDAFVSKLDSTGNFVWAKSMGGDEQDYGRSIVADEHSNIYFTGTFQTTANFDPNGTFYLYRFGGSDIFISKLDKDGNLMWAKNVGSSTDDEGKGIDIDRLGNVYITGSFQPNAEFNPGLNPEDTFSLKSYGSYDAFILKLDNAGNFVWAMQMGSIASQDGGNGIAVDNGYIYTTGSFTRTADFDPAGPNLNQLTAPGNAPDAFILKLFDCTSVSETTTIINGPDSICIGSTYVYSIDPIPGALNYHWVLPDDWEGVSDKDSITVTANSNGTISVIAEGVCDSIIINFNVELAMTPVEITVKDMQLGTTIPSDYNTWQWYLEGVKINGATDSIYNVAENGEYSVVVTGKDGCIDTAFYTVTNANSIKSNGIGTSIKVYPNPVSDRIFIEAPIAVSTSITSIDGRNLYNATFDTISKSFDVTGFSPGIYLIHIRNLDGSLIKVEKLIIAK